MTLKKNAKYIKFSDETLQIIKNRYENTTIGLLNHYLQITSLAHRTEPLVFKWADCLTKEVYTVASFEFERINTLLAIAILYYYQLNYEECAATVLQIRKIKKPENIKQVDLSDDFLDFLLNFAYSKSKSIASLMNNQYFYLNKAYKSLHTLYKQKGHGFSHTAEDYIKKCLSTLKNSANDLYVKYCIETVESLKKQNKTLCAYKMIESCKNINDPHLKSIAESLRADLKIQSQFDVKRDMSFEDESITEIVVKPFAEILKGVKFTDLAYNIVFDVVRQKISSYNAMVDKAIEELDLIGLTKKHKELDNSLSYFKTLCFYDSRESFDPIQHLHNLRDQNLVGISQMQETIRSVMKMLHNVFLQLQQAFFGCDKPKQHHPKVLHAILEELDLKYKDTQCLIYKISNLTCALNTQIFCKKLEMMPRAFILEYEVKCNDIKRSLGQRTSAILDLEKLKLSKNELVKAYAFDDKSFDFKTHETKFLAEYGNQKCLIQNIHNDLLVCETMKSTTHKKIKQKGHLHAYESYKNMYKCLNKNKQKIYKLQKAINKHLDLCQVQVDIIQKHTTHI